MSSLEIRVDPGAMGFEPLDSSASGRTSTPTSRTDDWPAGSRPSRAAANSSGPLRRLPGPREGSRGHRRHDLAYLFDDQAITSIAVMMLYEEGRFDLNDDVGQWIDALKELASGPAARPRSPHRPGDRTVRVHHLLSQMSGLTYGFHYATRPTRSIASRATTSGSRPCRPRPGRTRLVLESLVFQPGSGWNYSVSVDVLVTDRDLERPELRVVPTRAGPRPLAMTDTDWYCPKRNGTAGDALRAPRGDSFPFEELAKGATHARVFTAVVGDWCRARVTTNDS